MHFVRPSTARGSPSFRLSEDHVATIVDLLCKGTRRARPSLREGMLEPQITTVVREAMRIEKRALNLTNLEIHREYVVDGSSETRGRIDIVLRFLHQFGNEDAYVAVECKKVAARNSALNGAYVTEGVKRFASGKYARNHERAFMLGYVLALPIDSILDYLHGRMKKEWGPSAGLSQEVTPPMALAVRGNTVPQCSIHKIKLTHVFVDIR